MRYFGGHLGVTASALLDGQLDPASAERAWAHVHGCPTCCSHVEREGWVKTQLAAMAGEDAPPPQLLGSLYGLGAATGPSTGPSVGEREAWAAVQEIERRGRGRRRAGLAAAGAGSVSAAVLGLVSLTGGSLGSGATPANLPAAGLTRGPSSATPVAVAPLARAHGRLPTGLTGTRTTPAPPARGGEGTAGLPR